jgi:hypothetical protein
VLRPQGRTSLVHFRKDSSVAEQSKQKEEVVGDGVRKLGAGW